MIYWFKSLPEKIIYDKELFPVVKNKWLRKNMVGLGTALALIIIIANPFKITDFVLRRFANDGLNVSINIVLMAAFIIFAFLFVIIGHEFLHILAVYGKDDMSVTLSLWGIFVITNAELSKMRWLIFISLPLIILTILPLIISFLLPYDIAGLLRYFAVFNLGVSSLDIINTINIIFKPQNAIFWRGLYYLPNK